MTGRRRFALSGRPLIGQVTTVEGFLARSFDEEGVRSGIQKLGSCLPFSLDMFETEVELPLALLGPATFITVISCATKRAFLSVYSLLASSASSRSSLSRSFSYCFSFRAISAFVLTMYVRTASLSYRNPSGLLMVEDN